MLSAKNDEFNIFNISVLIFHTLMASHYCQSKEKAEKREQFLIYFDIGHIFTYITYTFLCHYQDYQHRVGSISPQRHVLAAFSSLFRKALLLR